MIRTVHFQIILEVVKNPDDKLIFAIDDLELLSTPCSGQSESGKGEEKLGLSALPIDLRLMIQPKGRKRPNPTRR